jgi:Uma2 family endonuclease
MSTAMLVPLEKYLNTVYRPDRDYVDGRLEKRNVGEWKHADLQAAIAAYLRYNARRFRVNTVTEIRVQVAPTRYRVADVCCVRRPPGESGIVTEPPALVIEILSPLRSPDCGCDTKDTVPQTEERIEDYLAMGVPYVWLLNPRKPDRAWIYQPDQPRREVRDRILTAGEIRVDLEELPRPEDYSE